MTDKVYIDFRTATDDAMPGLSDLRIRKWSLSPFECGALFRRQDTPAPVPIGADHEQLLVGSWRPISEADNSIAYHYDLGELKLGCSYPIWARDAEGRVFECLWSDNGKKAYWWDIEGESPVDPVEYMPHPLDRREDA